MDSFGRASTDAVARLREPAVYRVPADGTGLAAPARSAADMQTPRRPEQHDRSTRPRDARLEADGIDLVAPIPLVGQRPARSQTADLQVRSSKAVPAHSHRNRAAQRDSVAGNLADLAALQRARQIEAADSVGMALRRCGRRRALPAAGTALAGDAHHLAVEAALPERLGAAVAVDFTAAVEAADFMAVAAVDTAATGRAC